METKTTYLEKLLAREEVKWLPLGEVALIGTGSSNRQDEEPDGRYPFYVRSQNILRSSSYQFDETAIIIPGEGGIGDIFHYATGKYALHQRAYRIKIESEELLPKYVYYYLTNSFKGYILSKSVGATATSIRKPMLEKFLIPIPPLRVQQRIIEILDQFSELTTELKKELADRRKQYEYYRNELLGFKDKEVAWKTLGEVGEFVRGNGLQKKEFTESGVPAIHYGQIYTYYGLSTEKTKSFVSEDTAKTLRKVNYGDVVITNTAAPRDRAAPEAIRILSGDPPLLPQALTLLMQTHSEVDAPQEGGVNLAV